MFIVNMLDKITPLKGVAHVGLGEILPLKGESIEFVFNKDNVNSKWQQE